MQRRSVSIKPLGSRPSTGKDKMMNGLALFLVFSSLVAASLWSPTADRKPKDYPGAEEVIVKLGTRVVVVEYDIQGAGKTKVSISTPEAGLPQKPTTGEHKLKEAFDVLPNLGQGLSRGEPPAHPKELICDAFGKCKEIASKIGRAEHRVSEKAHEIPEGAKEMYSKVKEKVTQKAHDVEEEVEDAYAQGKEKIAEKIHEVQEGVKDAVKKAKHAAGPTYDLSKTIAKDVEGNISKIVSTSTDQMKQRVRGERQGEAKEGVEIAKSALDGFINQGEHDLSKRLYDATNYTLPSASFIRSLMCMIHILGFATAYGVSVWVTFFPSYVLAGALPYQQFGIVQSKIYPIYFKAMAFCVGLALLGHVLSQREKVFLGKAELFQAQTLFATLIIVLINLLFVEPRATKVMFERIRVENEIMKGQEGSSVEPVGEGEGGSSAEPGGEGEATAGASDPQVMGRLDRETVNNKVFKLNQTLMKLNSCSYFLNILTLLALKLHLIYLANRLYLTC